MNTYRTYFYSDLQRCACDIVARTPDEAIEIARRVAELDPEALLSDDCEGGDRPIQAIEVIDDDGYQLAAWQDDERFAARDLLEVAAAPDMLAALENLVARDLIRDTDGDHYDEVLDAIAKAKGGAECLPKPGDGLAVIRRPNRGKVRGSADILFERVYRDGKEVIYATTRYQGPQTWGAS